MDDKTIGIGLALVPVEPTAEMYRAVSDGAKNQDLADKRSKYVWDSMLSALPSMPISIKPFAWIGDYAACGGGRCVFTDVEAARITDLMCAKTPVYTLGAVAAAQAAIETLAAKGYTYNGAELWKPPVGVAPNFNLIDALRTELELVKKQLEKARGMLATVAACATSECEDCQEHAQLHVDAIDDLLKPAEAVKP